MDHRGHWFALVEFHDYPLGFEVCPYKVFTGSIWGCNEVDARLNAEIVINVYQTPAPVWSPV